MQLIILEIFTLNNVKNKFQLKSKQQQAVKALLFWSSFRASVRPSVRLSVRLSVVNIYFMWRDISVLSGDISTTFGTDIHHVSGRCWKGLQGQRSEIKGHMCTNVWMQEQQKHIFGQCGHLGSLFTHVLFTFRRKRNLLYSNLTSNIWHTRHTYRHTDRQTERQTHIHTDRHLPLTLSCRRAWCDWTQRNTS